MSDTRRFVLCLLASLIINSAISVLVGLSWRPQPVLAAYSGPHIKLIRIALLPPTRPVVKKHPTLIKKPVKQPRPHKRVRPGARIHSSQPAPLAKPAGGSHSGSPIMATAPLESPPPKVITSSRSARLITHNTPTPLPFTPAAQVVSANISSPTFTPTSVPATASGHGGGGAATGSGAGSGAGTGTGQGVGAGVSRDVGEPFGVGKGMAGDGAPRHIVYVLDISGSMTSRIDRAVSELTHALNGLQLGETFNIIAFSDRIQPYDSNMAPATPATIKQAISFLSMLQVDGGTNLEDAMTRALSLSNVNEVVVLTDGVPTTGETNFKKLARLIRERNINHARISTVGMVGKNPDGTDDSFEAAHLLRQIADDSGGAAKLVTLGVSTPE